MNVVLGGGIAGLIWAYYNNDYTIITKDVGGQMDSRFDIGPRYLHFSENARRFLEGLGLPIKERTIKVGYVNDEGYTKNPDSLFRQKYYMKSRRKMNLMGLDETVMNNNKNEFQVLDVDFTEMIKKITRKIENKIIKQQIISIDLFRKQVETTTKNYNYSHLVSTIPLPIFCELTNIWLNELLESCSITYCLVNKSFIDSEFDFEYDCSYTSKFHRITKTSKGFVLDIFGEVHKNTLKREYCYLDSLTLNSQIIPLKSELLPKIDSVRFMGRYGSWDRNFKTEKIIDEAIK